MNCAICSRKAGAGADPAPLWEGIMPGRMDTLNYAVIKYCDIANGPGVRTSLFVSGCTHHCDKCFNSIAWPFDYGQPFTEKTEQEIIDSMSDYIAGITLLGGEPMEPENLPALLRFIRRFRQACPGKSVWCYSGYTLEQLTGKLPSRVCVQDAMAMLPLLDVLVDGPYVDALHDITLRFCGSSNQRLLDMPKTLEAGEPVLWQDDRMFAQRQLELKNHGRE